MMVRVAVLLVTSLVGTCVAFTVLKDGATQDLHAKVNTFERQLQDIEDLIRQVRQEVSNDEGKRTIA